MKVHPQVQHVSGIVSVTMTASFVGDQNDVSDQQRIQAYGDPKVNIAGLFTDPNDNTFAFTFPTSEMYVGATTEMLNHTARFMTSLPVNQPVNTPTFSYSPFNAGCVNTQQQQQGVLDCIVSDPVRAATIWAAAIDARVAAVMTLLRAKTPAQLTTLPDTTA